MCMFVPERGEDERGGCRGEDDGGGFDSEDMSVNKEFILKSQYKNGLVTIRR